MSGLIPIILDPAINITFRPGVVTASMGRGVSVTEPNRGTQDSTLTTSDSAGRPGWVS